MTKHPTKLTLITNLDFVIVSGVRTYTHALLVSETDGLFDDVSRKLRGFGTDSALPTFDVEIPSIKYTITAAEGGPVIMSDNTEPRPLFRGAIMQIEDGPRVDLIACDTDKAIDVFTYPEAKYEESGDLHMRVWRDLANKVASYWTAPAMPGVVWGPPDHIARLAKAHLR